MGCHRLALKRIDPMPLQGLIHTPARGLRVELEGIMTLVRCEITDDHWSDNMTYQLGTFDAASWTWQVRGLRQAFDRYDWRYCGETDHANRPELRFYVLDARGTPLEEVVSVEDVLRAMEAANAKWNGKPKLRPMPNASSTDTNSHTPTRERNQ